MNYHQTLKYLFSRLPIYQRKGNAAYKINIGNVVSACEKIGNPHKIFKSIHIAGTNGKGSSSHMLASVFQEAGYTVGLYTSPHLKDFRERIKINGEMICKDEVVRFVKENRLNFEKIDLSFFEFTVVLAFNYFAKSKIDIAIIETGLGGKLDSTNIINPELSIITNIGLDHTYLLGNTIEEIAKEKGGIIKNNTTVIIGRNQSKANDIFKNIANEKKATLKYATNNEYSSDLRGNYQKENINTVVTAIIELQKNGWKINNNNIREGLLNTIKNTGLFGRWQILQKNPLIICDTCHNSDAIKEVVKQLIETPSNKLHIVFGVANDKDLDTIMNILPKHAIYYFCKANIERAIDSEELKKKANKYQLKGGSYSSVKEAYNEARIKAKTEDLIFIGGSTFVVAEVL